MNIRIMIELIMPILQVILFVMNFIRCACKAPHGGRPPAVRVPFKIPSLFARLRVQIRVEFVNCL